MGNATAGTLALHDLTVNRATQVELYRGCSRFSIGPILLAEAELAEDLVEEIVCCRFSDDFSDRVDCDAKVEGD